MTENESFEQFYPTEYPCEVCGQPVFQRIRRRKRFCSKVCSRRYYHQQHPERRHWTHVSCTISVLYADDGLRSFVGFGDSPGDAHEHARAQAQRLGSYTEVGYVTIPKINADLSRTHG